MNWRIWVPAALGIAVMTGAIVFRWLRRSHDPEDVERSRRARLSQTGRIAEGQVLEFMEVPAPVVQSRSFIRGGAPDGPAFTSDNLRKLVCYSYSISGVGYETAQDITSIFEAIELHRVAAGQPVSVKYDPVNPGDSILIADDWSGLH